MKRSAVSIQLSALPTALLLVGCAAEPKPRPVTRQVVPAIAAEASPYGWGVEARPGRMGHSGTLHNWLAGDTDLDGDVDADDWAAFEHCASGPGVRLRDLDPDGTPSACWMVDVDDDQDVDQIDFAALQRQMGGRR